MTILLPGGLGYIGSHTAVELLNSGYDVIIVDNLYNSKIEVLDKIKQITSKDIKFYKEDVLSTSALDKIFSQNKIDGVINFAGYKAVGESVTIPLKYYENNIMGCINILNAMKKYGVKNFIFSSTASIYGDEKRQENISYKEDAKVGDLTNPYSKSKYMIEMMLNDLYRSDDSFNIVILRYFNPIGSHESALIGDDPNGIPNNLMPYILKVATNKLPYLHVFGNDYNTEDGTGIRDYIHIVDLANAHKKAIEYLNNKQNGIELFNIGTGKGYSVLDVVNCFKDATNIEIPYKIEPRRPGDVAYCVADPSKANKILNWKAQYDLKQMCYDSYNFAKKTLEK